MATTRSSAIRTTLHAGQSLLSALWAKATELVRERAGQPAPSTAPDKHSPEHEAMMEANDAPLVTSDADADAFDALKARRSARVAKPLPIK
jgi:hypothetical protein